MFRFELISVAENKKELIKELELVLYKLKGACIKPNEKVSEKFCKPHGGYRILTCSDYKTKKGLLKSLENIDNE